MYRADNGKARGIRQLKDVQCNTGMVAWDAYIHLSQPGRKSRKRHLGYFADEEHAAELVDQERVKCVSFSAMQPCDRLCSWTMIFTVSCLGTRLACWLCALAWKVCLPPQSSSLDSMHACCAYLITTGMANMFCQHGNIMA